MSLLIATVYLETCCPIRSQRKLFLFVLARRQINHGFETSHLCCHVSMFASSGTSSANGHMKKLMSSQGAPTVLFLDPSHLSWIYCEWLFLTFIQIKMFSFDRKHISFQNDKSSKLKSLFFVVSSRSYVLVNMMVIGGLYCR